MNFVVDEEGNVTNVRANMVSGKCSDCVSEAINVFSSSRKWEPAIQNNEPIKYYAQQPLTIQVLETKKK